jgi:hypothetical protein
MPTKPIITKAQVMEFLKKNPLTEDEVLSLYAQTITDCYDATISPKLHEQIMTALAGVEGYSDFLRATISKDMQRYFNAQTPLDQLLIKGAANRTLYFKSCIHKSKNSSDTDGNNVIKETLGIKRYAK